MFIKHKCKEIKCIFISYGSKGTRSHLGDTAPPKKFQKSSAPRKCTTSKPYPVKLY